ncbi:MAG: hypothetical protein M3R02_19035 [Chloroflexota bacterium]|nr:hypothetical protein [Chloroflexota bacterium]
MSPPCPINRFLDRLLDRLGEPWLVEVHEPGRCSRHLVKELTGAAFGGESSELQMMRLYLP